MKNKKNMRRFLSGFLAMLTVLSTILSPILSYAADVVPVPEEPPLYEHIKIWLNWMKAEMINI